MESVLASELVQFHGVWLAKYMISDKLVRSIGQEFGRKPARTSRFSLSPSGISMDVLPTQDGKPGRTEKIAFEALRDVSFNRYNMKCLMVVYLDSKNMFSIMVCSSPDERVVLTITRAYKDHKTSLLMRQSGAGPENTRNWTLRQRQLQIQAAGAAVAQTQIKDIKNNNNDIGHSNGQGTTKGSTGSDDLDDDIFMMDDDVIVRHENEELQREAVDTDGDGQADAFNVAVQTADFGSDTDSVISNDSLQSLKDDLHSLSEEMKAIKFLLEKSTGISSEEYYRRRDRVGNRHAVAFHTTPRMVSNGDHDTEPQDKRNNSDSEPQKVRFSDTTEEINGAPQHGDDGGAEEDEDYDLRSVGMQTDQDAKGAQILRKRYLKRVTNGSSSNIYRDKLAASRKRTSTYSNTSASANDVSGGGSLRGGSLRASSVNGAPHAAARYSTGNLGPSRPSSLKSHDHVSRPIESVYHSHVNSGSRGFNNRRNKLMIVPVSSPLPQHPGAGGQRFGSVPSSQANS